MRRAAQPAKENSSVRVWSSSPVGGAAELALIDLPGKDEMPSPFSIRSLILGPPRHFPPRGSGIIASLEEGRCDTSHSGLLELLRRLRYPGRAAQLAAVSQ